MNLENPEEKSEGLEELSNQKLRQGLSYADGKINKDINIKFWFQITSLFYQKSVGSSVHKIGNKPGEIIKN